jgi:hypothetical protein
LVFGVKRLILRVSWRLNWLKMLHRFSKGESQMKLYLLGSEEDRDELGNHVGELGETQVGRLT